MPAIISIVGNSDSGKTTLIEKLIPELKRRGYRVGTVKHAHHGFAIDKPGKDSFRHQSAGATTVIVTSPGQMAMVRDMDQVDLDSLVIYCHDLDLVITEGFKKGPHPKIEVFRSELQEHPLDGIENRIALVTDADIDMDVPRYRPGEIIPITDLIEEEVL